MNRQTISLILFIFITSVSLLYWYDDATEVQQNKSAETWLSSPDYFISDVITTEYDQRGKIKYTMKATDLVHIPLNDETHVTRPDLIFYNQQEPWQAKADKGLIHASGGIIDLSEDVTLTRKPDDNNATQLSTDTLTLDVDNEQAHTDNAVEITHPNGVLTAVGMQVQLKDNSVRLLSKVKGFHEPD